LDCQAAFKWSPGARFQVDLKVKGWEKDFTPKKQLSFLAIGWTASAGPAVEGSEGQSGYGPRDGSRRQSSL